MGLDVTRHEPPLFRFQIRPREGREVHVRPRQGDTGRVLVTPKQFRVDLLDYVEIVVEAPRLVRHFTEHVREVDLVQGKHFADDVEHPVPERGPHPVQFAQKPFQDAALYDRLPILRGNRDEVERVHVSRLSDAVDTAQALLETGRVPGQVVVDHQVAELKVDPLARRLGRHAYLAARPEILLGLPALARVHPAVDLAGRVTPRFDVLPQMVQRIPVLGEDQELAPPVFQFIELRSLQAVAQCDQLGVAPAFANAPRTRNQIAQLGDLRPELIQFRRGRRLVDEAVAVCFIEIVLVLLGVVQAPLQLRQTL